MSLIAPIIYYRGNGSIAFNNPNTISVSIELQEFVNGEWINISGVATLTAGANSGSYYAGFSSNNTVIRARCAGGGSVSSWDNNITPVISATPTSTPTNTVTPTKIPTTTQNVIPTPTPTITPTKIPTTTQNVISTPTPTATKSNTAASTIVECYVLYSNTNHLWTLTSRLTNKIITINPPCFSGHSCDRTNFMPQMIFNVNNTSETLTINASNPIDVNNAAEISSNVSLPVSPIYDQTKDRLDYCTFTIPDTTNTLTNASIKLNCLLQGGCHDNVTIVILIVNGDIIFNACVNPNGDPFLLPINPIAPPTSTPTPIKNAKFVYLVVVLVILVRYHLEIYR